METHFPLELLDDAAGSVDRIDFLSTTTTSLGRFSTIHQITAQSLAMSITPKPRRLESRNISWKVA
jgi:hypothetical protein